MRTLAAVCPDKLRLVEELVEWRVKVPEVAFLAQVDRPLVRRVYRWNEAPELRRPPTGRTQSPVSASLTVSQRLQYVGLAGHYLNTTRRGLGGKEAMLAIYRDHRNTCRVQGMPADTACAGSWIELWRMLEANTASLQRCLACNGQHLVFHERTLRTGSVCPWCRFKAEPRDAFFPGTYRAVSTNGLKCSESHRIA